MPKIPNKTFCILPFVHGTIVTNGDIKLCCVSSENSKYNIKTNTVKNWWQSLKDVRQRMLQGDIVDACSRCYDQEAHGLISHRQSSNKKFKIVSEKYADKIIERYYNDLTMPIDYELQITNICNLRCIMCGEFDSSALLSENKILKISNYDQSQYIWNQEEINKVLALLQNTNTKSVTFRGGEPFLIPDIKKTMLDVVNSGRSKEIDLQIVTNCTTFDQEWVTILNNFKSIWIICSIDAVGDRFEYIRYGANWVEVCDNVRLMKTIKHATITVNSVVQNINAVGLADLINWCKQQDIYIKLTRIQDPEYLSIDVLPDKIKNHAHSLLSAVDYDKVEDLSETIRSLEVIGYDKTLWDDFIGLIKIKDNHRKTNFLDKFPEFKNYAKIS